MSKRITTLAEFQAATVAEQMESVLLWATEPHPDAEARRDFALELAVTLAVAAAEDADQEGAA